MAWFLALLAVVLGLGVAAGAVGRALAIAGGMRLARSGVEGLAAALFAGTAFLALCFGWGSYLGLAARGCLAVTAAASAVVGGVAWARRRAAGPGPVLRRGQWRRAWPGLVVAGGMMLTAGLVLLPVAGGGCYNAFDDSHQYIAVSEWLHEHGFAEPADERLGPADRVAAWFQALGHRMGPMFLLALVGAALPGVATPVLYPAVMAWGAALNVAGVFLLARWGLRVARPAAAAGALAVAAAYTTLSWSSANGFLCQVYGTAFLAFGLALLGRLVGPGRWRAGNAGLLGLAGAGLLSMYSELTPLLALAGAAWLAAAWGPARRTGRRGRLAAFTALAAVALLVWANGEVVRAARCLPVMARVSGVGRHYSWSAADYARFALGSYRAGDEPRPLEAVRRRSPGAWPAVLAAGMFGLGLLRLRRRTAWPVAGVLAGGVGLALFFRFGRPDPWTGELGHTWNLFKLAQWSFPVVASLQAAALGWLPWRRAAVPVLSLAGAGAVLLACWPTFRTEARSTTQMMAGFVGPKAGLADLAALCGQVRRLPPGPVYVIDERHGPWPGLVPAYFFYPRRFVSGWRGSGWLDGTMLAEDGPDSLGPDTVFVRRGSLPFEEPPAFGFTPVDGREPLIVRAETARGPVWARGDLRVGEEPVRLLAWSPRPVRAVLRLEARCGTAGEGSRTVRLTLPDGTAQDQAVEAGPGASLAAEVWLPAGVSRVEVQCWDEGTGEGLVIVGASLVRDEGQAEAWRPGP